LRKKGLAFSLVNLKDSPASGWRGKPDRFGFLASGWGSQIEHKETTENEETSRRAR
jgi:hypothetical protein